MGDAPAPSGAEDDEWEICNDNGFVYKRRRRLRPADAPPPPLAEDPEAELRRHRLDRRRRCLLHLRDRYRRELEQWERLSSSLLDLTAPPPSAASSSKSELPSSASPERSSGDAQQTLIDDLLSQVEAQEAMLRKLSDICDNAESLCREKEESLVESLMEMPIWGSPRSLLTSLTD
ncbi:hypothetical protein Cni_G06135 [Canna indica]|uniref:Uncharacterized protein n=1 Tax=Canna indica TaxID=4628 RepID=A0AAQ3JYS7_9LILI|nr:hypothetical protein Cni_G06135 [Canna indica]